MDSSMLRHAFFDFFVEHGHEMIPSSSLIPDDPSVLLTTAGMQQFKPYYTGEADPFKSIHPNLGRPIGSKNVVSIQKSFRTSDIDEVGDERHLTFFEMMGNFSFGGYFKDEAIRYAYDFLTKKAGLKISYVTIFAGKDDIGVPKDAVSREIWKTLDPSLEVIEQGMEDVFWGPTGGEGPCGPTTEIYCKNGAGQDIEVWNIVFNEFFFPGSREELLSGSSRKKLEPLATPGVDTGMGLERLAMVVQKKKNIFETDLLMPIFQKINIPEADKNSEQAKRIIADHIRASTFLIADGVRPSNKEVGYILRRLMRRIIFYGVEDTLLADEVIRHYHTVYPELKEKREEICRVSVDESLKFSRTLRKGLNELEKMRSVDAKTMFYLYQSFGLPYELIKDFDGGRRAKNLTREQFDEEFKKHQEISRAEAETKFGGHGLYLKTGEVTIRDESEVEKVTRLHTATHLMHAGLRAVLGPEVRQDGSDITAERTRFDFRFGRKVTPEELQKVEAWVNDVMRRDLAVECREMSFEEAVAEGALGFFRQKYPPRVKVYTVCDAQTGEIVSKELCGGPHVSHTSEIGRFRILKEESSSAGVRRIRATVENL